MNVLNQLASGGTSPASLYDSYQGAKTNALNRTAFLQDRADKQRTRINESLAQFVGELEAVPDAQRGAVWDSAKQRIIAQHPEAGQYLADMPYDPQALQMLKGGLEQRGLVKRPELTATQRDAHAYANDPAVRAYVDRPQPDPKLDEQIRHNKAIEAATAERNRAFRDRLTNPPMPKPPAGYRYGADNNLERTPGGPADQKFRAERAEDQAALDAGLSAIDATVANIDSLIGGEADDPKTPRDERREHPGLRATTGAFDARTPTFFQDSKDAEVLQEALRAQASIQGLANVRGSSGSIGSMTQAEWPRLESLITALQQTQGTPQFKENLRKYRAELAVVRRRLQNKFKETYDGGGRMPEMPQQAAPAAQDVDALVDFYLNQP